MAPLARRRVTPAFRRRPSLSVAPEHPPITRAASRELWLAVHLPEFMLDALGEIAQAVPGRPPVAVVDLERNGKVVRACAASARQAGVQAGMSINSAHALVPHLHPLARDPRRERALLEAVARCGLRFTSRVSLEPPDGVLLEVRGSLRLFGGARALCERLQQEIAALAGATALQVAITPAPLASLWFARQGGPRPRFVRSAADLAARLAPLPLGCTRWPARSIELLGTMGVRTLGECLRLPRDGFARRLGVDLLAQLDRATGRLAEPRAAYAASDRFTTRREIEPEIGDVARLERALAPLVAELCAFLRERDRGVQAIEIQLRHRDTPLTRLRLKFAQPVGAQPERIGRLLHERLGCLALPGPVRSLRLVSGPLLELPALAAELFSGDRRDSGGQLPQLVERLRARLGHDAVHGLACVPEHRPEAAWRAIEPRAPSAGASLRAAVAEPHVAVPGGARRPLWLLDVPESCDASRLLQFEEGPECIESGWWDGHDVARDYYVARGAQGERLWVFRNRRPTDPPGWFVHGRFA
jgi:protein ImuB